jgi:hypothetical protein
MSVCGFIKASGERCRAQALRDSQWCYVHAPELAEERGINNRKGGRTAGKGRPKGGTELLWAKQRLKEIAEDVLEGRIDSRRGAVAVQALSALKGVVDTELRSLELKEQEERLSELERLAEQPRRGRRFG